MKIIDIPRLALQDVSHNPRIKKHTILNTLEVPHITLFSIAYVPPGEIAATHTHSDMMEIFLVQSGTGVMRIDHQQHTLSAGRCVLVAPGETHEIENTGHETLKILCIGVQSSQAPALQER